jgi:5'-methylthioinosine phosphorylase
MTELAIIGGSGLTTLKGLEIIRREVARTPYGECSAPMAFGKLGGVEVLFLPRHGPRHTIPPHEVNYRANLWALKEAGIKKIIAVGAVGGVTEAYQAAGTLSLPTQIIDYTYGREHTFYTAANKQVIHTDFTDPYCEELRSVLVKASERAGLNAVDGGTYGATQGPRFETAAEVRRMEQDGVDIIGMTGMPEASLARELELCYTTVAMTVNPAAGKSEKEISIKEIEENLSTGMAKVRQLLEAALPDCCF